MKCTINNLRHIYIAMLLLAFAMQPAISTASTAMNPDEEDLDESIRMPIRRLHPERPTLDEQKRQRQERQRQDKLNKKARDKEKREQHRASVAPASNNASQAQQQQSSSMTAEERATIEKLLATDYSTPFVYKRQRMVWKDDPVTEGPTGLLHYFNRIDEGKGETTYMPKRASLDQNQNRIFLYFKATGATPSRLRFHAQYYADDPIKFTSIKFLIDGFDYDYKPANVQRGKGRGRMIWENCDEPVQKADKDLIYALAHCTWARVTFVGSRGVNHVKMLSKEELEDIAHTLLMYRAMGGTL